MKILRILGVIMLVFSTFMVDGVSAKSKKVPNVYIFGFSASFKDSVVYVTEVQKLDSAWIDSKSKFLLARENYSDQLKNYLNEAYKMPHRTCIVMYATKKKDIEKKYTKLLSKYKSPKNKTNYDIRIVEPEKFKFTYIDLSYDESYNNAE